MSISGAASAANVAINTYKRVEAGKAVQDPNLVAILLALGLTAERVQEVAPSTPTFNAATVSGRAVPNAPRYTVQPIEETGAGQENDDAWFASVMQGLRVIDDIKQGRLGPAITNEAARLLLEQMIEGARQRGKGDVAEMLRSELRRLAG